MKQGIKKELTPGDVRKIEARILARKQDFDIISLLRLLGFMGYPPEKILFKSYNSLSSQAGLIKRIWFMQDPIKKVIITLNMGLLSAQGTLPNYFQKEIDKGMMDVPSFYEFIGYFDHSLIANLFQYVYPELKGNRLENYEMTKSGYLKMLDYRSATTLDWMFRLTFPELEVQVEKSTFPRNIAMKSLKLGMTILGENAVFGDKASIRVPGRKITLFCDEALTSRGEPWAREIKKRLKRYVFPLLRTVGIDLQVTLVIKSQKQWVKLHQDSYLGYDKIRGGSDQYKRIRIFKGNIASL